MPWGVVAAAVVGAYGANKQAKANERGARGQQDAADAATAEQRRQYDLTRQDQMPFLDAGYDALRRQQQALDGDWSGFENSPDYAYARDQSLQALERGAAARGGFTGGGADADRLAMASGLANQNFGNYWDRLAGRAGQAQSSATNLGALGMQMAGNIGNNYARAANANASAYANNANLYSQAAAGIGGAFNNWYQGNRANNPGGSPWYIGNNPGRG